MSLAQLAQFAATNNNTRAASKAVHTLTTEEARERVIIKDGSKKAAEDGSQALTLVLGKYTLALDAIAPKATRINAPADKVEEFTGLLQEAIDNGTLDEAIVEAQAKAKVTAEKPRVVTAPASVDLDALEGEEGTEEGEAPFEGDELGEDDLG